MPVVDKYEFGKIVIGGKSYTKDVIILPDRVISNWWRKEGHSLCWEDLAEALAATPKVLVIGTGESGVMQVPADLIVELEKTGVKVVVEQTPQAVQTFNRISKTEPAAAALHLTC